MTAASVGVYGDPDAGPSKVIPADRETPVIIDSETGEKLSFGDVVADRFTGSWTLHHGTQCQRNSQQVVVT